MSSPSHDIEFALFDTTLGTCAIAWNHAGICRLLLPEDNNTAMLDKLAQLPARRHDKSVPRYVITAIEHIVGQLAGEMAPPHKAKLNPCGVSPFRMRVYHALQQVPAGTTVSYGELAALAGSPGAARAVGSAMANNPWPLLVPCHRVLAAGGKLGGFTAHGGVATKRRLLKLEGVNMCLEHSARSPVKRATPSPARPGGPRPLPYDAVAATRKLRRADRTLARWMTRVGPITMQLKPKRTVFAALAEAIVYQQLTTKAARAIYARVKKHLARKRILRANDIAGMGVEPLRTLGLSRAKARALLDLAEKTQARKLPTRAALLRMTDAEIVTHLSAVRGVGPWTVHMFLMFQLGRPDVLASGDYALRKGLGVVLQRDDVPSPAEFEAYGKRWRPFRSAASWYLWQILELCG